MQTVWAHNSVAPLVDRDSNTHHILVVTLDIAERKQAEAQTSLLLRELDHRVKNILAVVSAIVNQTLKTSPSPGAFAASIEGRIAAIARAHSVLTQKGEMGDASFRELVTTELAPYNRNGDNLSIPGPNLGLTHQTGRDPTGNP